MILRDVGQAERISAPLREIDQGTKMKWTLATRILHGTVAAAVLHQLVVSWLMERPRPGRNPANIAYEFHEVIGLASLATLGVYWLWVLFRRRDQSAGALMPWFSVARRRSLLRDIGVHLQCLARFRIPDPSGESPLASAVHGLGLLAASAMAVTGVMVFAVMGGDGYLPAVGRIALDLHRMMANLMWAYLIGHAGISLIHQAAGHPVLMNMFMGGTNRP